ncbi:C-type lectin domain family 2 member B-like isoform X2 [Dendrobates tinctorius]|uniref:C-type lectin domain family 2 member B-like isoform X2 n=1 Tax=Dendrobates tinctorius TaxID=92724 RepID=UPI003CCA215C
MAEEITYADLRFYDSRCVSISQTLEKNTEGISSDRNNNSCRCQKKTYIIIGILIVILLLALLTMAILRSCLLCPMNWVLIQKKCYYMLDKMLSWQESQSFCESQNSSLIMPKSLEERKFITCNFQRSYAENLWIGLTCSLKLNERWLWLDNTAYIIFPSQCKEIKCASFDYDIRLATPCSTRLKTICQRLPVNLPSIN